MVPELVPRACTCRKPARSDGIVVKGAALRPVAAVSDRGLLVSHLARPSKPTTATGLRRREESDQVHPRTRAQETRAHPDEERGCSPATNTRATGERQERKRGTRDKEKKGRTRDKKYPNRVCTPRNSRGAPPLTQLRPPSGLTQKPLEGKLAQLPLPRGKAKGRETRAYCSLFLHGPYARVLGPFPTRKGPQRGPWRMAFGVS